MRKGILIAFEGGDYTTKSTQYRLAFDALKPFYQEKLVGESIREPGSTDVGESVRQILLRFDSLRDEYRLSKQLEAALEMNAQLRGELPTELLNTHKRILEYFNNGPGKYSELSFDMPPNPVAEDYLYQTARAQLWDKKLIPLLSEGRIVMVDRCGYSSDVYQGGVRGLGIDWIESLNMRSTQGVRPDKVIVFQIEPERGIEWIKQVQAGIRTKKDRIDKESLDFHRKIFELYWELPRRLPKGLADTFFSIDMSEFLFTDEKRKEKAIREVHAIIMDELSSTIETLSERLN